MGQRSRATPAEVPVLLQRYMNHMQSLRLSTSSQLRWSRKWRRCSSTTCPGSRCSSEESDWRPLPVQRHAHVHLCVTSTSERTTSPLSSRVGVVTEWVKATCVSKDYSSFIDKVLRFLFAPECGSKVYRLLGRYKNSRYLAVNYIRMVWFSQLVIFGVQALQLVLVDLWLHPL